MTALERLLLAADLLEPSPLGGEITAGHHEHLMKGCPWYRNISEEKNCGHDPAEHCDLGKAVTLTPRTAEASTVVQPTVPPGGPGLFHMKGRHLPPYVEHLYKHLVGRYGKQEAYGVAIGIVKKWKAGINPGGWKTKSGMGKHVHADVRAAAAKNMAEWEQDKADAHASHGGSVKATMALAQPAPGGLRDVAAPAGGPSVPRPPQQKAPTAASIRKIASQVPDCEDPQLSASARTHLEAAAVKLEKDDEVEALRMLRVTQADLFSAHKADLGPGRTATVPGAVNAVMIASRDREMTWRRLEREVNTAIAALRSRYFGGRVPATEGPARLAGESALARVLRLAGGGPGSPAPGA